MGRKGGKYRLGIWDIANAFHEQMDLGQTHYQGFDAFRICARLLPEYVGIADSIFSASKSSAAANHGWVAATNQWMAGWLAGCMDGWWPQIIGWMAATKRWMAGCMDGWMSGWMDGSYK